MIRALLYILLSGFIWLFVFSIPFNESVRVYDIGYYYLVKSKPVEWIYQSFLIPMKEKISLSLENSMDFIKEKKESFNTADIIENSKRNSMIKSFAEPIIEEN